MCEIVKKNFRSIAGIIFLFAGSLHAMRVIMDWQLLVGPWAMPVWVSIVAAFVTLPLAWIALRK